MRRAAEVAALTVFCALVVKADVYVPESKSSDVIRQAEADCFRRSIIRNHWFRLAANIAITLDDGEMAKGVLKLQNMPTAFVDSAGIHDQDHFGACGTKFLVILPEDMQLLSPKTRDVLSDVPVAYLPKPNIILVTRDVGKGDIAEGKMLLLVAMQSNLPAAVVANDALFYKWRQSALERLALPPRAVSER